MIKVYCEYLSVWCIYCIMSHTCLEWICTLHLFSTNTAKYEPTLKERRVEFYRAKVHIFFFYFNLYNIYKYTCISCTEDADMRKALTVNLWSNLPYSLLFYFCVTFYIITRIFISLRIYCYFDNDHTFCDIAVKRDHVHTCWAWALVCEF